MMDDLLLAFQSNNHQGSGPYFEGYCGEHQQHYPGLEQLSGLDAGGGFLCYIERFKCWFVLTSWIIPSLWTCPPSTAWTPWRDEQQPWKHAPCSDLVNCLYSSSRPQCCCRTLYYLCHEREYGVTLSEGGRPTHAHASRRRHFPLWNVEPLWAVWYLSPLFSCLVSSSTYLLEFMCACFRLGYIDFLILRTRMYHLKSKKKYWTLYRMCMY